MTINDLSTIHAQLIQLKNIAILTEILFKPIEQLMQENNWTQDKTIEKKEKAYDFLKKYAFDYIMDAVEDIKDITNKEYDIIQHKIIQ